jgi:hypothetical protein
MYSKYFPKGVKTLKPSLWKQSPFEDGG